MADFAVNYDAMDMGSAPQSALAVGPTTYRAFTNDGDFAGEVNMAYRGPVRVIDPATGKSVFESTDPDAAMKAFALVNGVSNSDGGKASWAVQIDNGNGWETAAMDNIDTKKQSLLGKLADIALPILGAILLPGVGGVLAAMGSMGSAAAGAALGSMASSVGQGRSIEDAAKRALISAVTAGAASGVSGMVASNMAAQAVAKGTLTAAEAASMGATASQLVSAGLTPAAAQAAIQAGKALTDVVVLGGTGAATGAANLAVNAAGNLIGNGALNTLQGGTGADTIKGPEDTTVAEVTVMPEGVKNSINMALEKGLTPAEVAAMFGVSAAAVAMVGQSAVSAAGPALATTPVETTGALAEAGNPAAGQIAANSGLSTAATGGIEGFATTADMMASANMAVLAGGSALTSWIAAHPLAAAQLGIAALGAVAGGSGVDGNGLATGGGTPPALQQSALFKKALPAPSGIFANLTPRDVSKSVTDWNNYGAGPEQSFFNSVPVRASGVTPDPKLVVTPSNPTTPTGPTTGTGTTATGTTGTGQTPTNLAVQNMTKYGQTPGVLDLRNQPTSVDNPYAGYATTRTPPAGAVALPATSNARFVVQEPMTAEELAKQARMSAMTVGMGTTKPGTPDLAVKSTGTPSQPTNPASATATAPTGRPTDAYSAADLARFDAFSPETAASMRNINDLMAKKAAAEAAAKPTTDGTMNQFQLDFAGLKEQPKAAPLGVDPLGYYYASNAGMNNAERAKYNADLDRSTILNNEPRMSLIDSPEWLNENFGVKLPAQKAATQTASAVPDFISKDNPFEVNYGPKANTDTSGPDLAALKGFADAHPELVNYGPQANTNPNRMTPAQLADLDINFKHGGTTSRAFAVNGAGDGREDKIDAKLSDGEYVIDAETVALLGNGSSKAGAQQLDKFRVNIRKHKGQKLASGKFSANAKSPEAYMAGGRS